MSSIPANTTSAPTPPQLPSSSVALIARQAIVNAQHVVIGYELFNRSRTGPTHTAATDVAFSVASFSGTPVETIRAAVREHDVTLVPSGSPSQAGVNAPC